uniref:ZZ-type domain-containing protein n=1 Tax=viral metagenome TaxID=1070528 RepID=A0A6C0E7R5_9ZZZZ
MSEATTFYSAGFYSPEGNFTKIPLYRRHFKVRFGGVDLIIEETQDYLNRFKHDVEAEFKFPAKLISLFMFEYRIDDDEWTVMQVGEKHETEEKYNTAVKQGHQAVLAKQDNDKIYTIKIGRLRSNQKLSIRFKYYSTYDITSESLSYTFALTSMQPYLRAGETAVGLPVWSGSLSDGSDNLPYGISIDAEFIRSGPFDVNYISNKVTTFTSGDDNRLTLPRQILDGRINVTFQIKPHGGFASEAFQWSDPDGQKYIQMSFANYFKEKPVDAPPDYFDVANDGDWDFVDASDVSANASDVKPKVNRRIILIGDGSGSMGGDPIENLQNAMKLAVRDLPECEFSVAMFGTSYRFYPGEILQTNQPYQIHTGISCDNCQMLPIKGTRHKCNECRDYDLCHNCYIQNISMMFHHHKFDIIDVKKPELPKLPECDDKYWRKQTDANMVEVDSWLSENCTARYGGTEMFSVVNEAYRRIQSTRVKGQRYQDMILLMTDGDVGDGMQSKLVELISKHKDVTFFTMGIGHSHSPVLVEKLALAGNGYCSHVFFSDDVPTQVQTIMRCLNTAHVRNASLVWEDCDVECTSQNPIRLLFENEPCYVLAKVKSMGKRPRVSLKTNVKGVLKTVFTFDLENLPTSQFPLDQSFAMTRLKELSNDDQLSKEQKSRSIIPLAIKYNVITQYTAAVGVVKSNPSANKYMEKIYVPIASPQRGSGSCNMGSYSHAYRADPAVMAACADTMRIMRNNIEKVIERGEELDGGGDVFRSSRAAASSMHHGYASSMIQEREESIKNMEEVLRDLAQDADELDSVLHDTPRSIQRGNTRGMNLGGERERGGSNSLGRQNIFVEQSATCDDDEPTEPTTRSFDPTKSAPAKSSSGPVKRVSTNSSSGLTKSPLAKSSSGSTIMSKLSTSFSGFKNTVTSLFNKSDQQPQNTVNTSTSTHSASIKSTVKDTVAPPPIENTSVSAPVQVKSAPVRVSKYSDEQIMENLIKCQSMDGGWTSENVKNAGLYLQLPTDLTMNPKLMETVLVVAFFHRIMSLSSRWNTSYKKALKWLTDNDVGKTTTWDQTKFLHLACQLTEN